MQSIRAPLRDPKIVVPSLVKKIRHFVIKRLQYEITIIGSQLKKTFKKIFISLFLKNFMSCYVILRLARKVEDGNFF